MDTIISFCNFFIFQAYFFIYKKIENNNDCIVIINFDVIIEYIKNYNKKLIKNVL